MTESQNDSGFAKQGLQAVSPGLAKAGADQKTARCSTVGDVHKEKANQV